MRITIDFISENHYCLHIGVRDSAEVHIQTHHPDGDLSHQANHGCLAAPLERPFFYLQLIKIPSCFNTSLDYGQHVVVASTNSFIV